MGQRLNYFERAPKAMTLLLQQEDMLHKHFDDSDTLNLNILDLVKLRASQINQCAFCIDMHYKEATNRGETPERLYGLNAWRDMPFYSEREQLALEWTEHLTAGKPVSDELYERILAGFGDESMIHLTIAINAINSWNRVSKVFKTEVGSFVAS